MNDGDSDDDLIPDFADGFGMFGEEGNVINNENAHFVKAVLDVSNMSPIINWDAAKIKFKYSASDPSNTKMTSRDGMDWTEYKPADGMIRIWTKDACEARNYKSVANGGDFVPGDDAEFYANDLLKGETVKTLYIEGIGNGTTNGLIEVKFSPDGKQPYAPDEVRVTVVGLDTDVDSDNNQTTNSPSRDGNEDRIEASNKKNGDSVPYPGKIIPVNDGDADNDKIPDFADFEIKKGKFYPLIVELPESLDMEKLTLKIEYSASDPNDVKKEGNAKDGYTYSPAGGMMRIWTKDASANRNPKSAKLIRGTAGDWLEPGEYPNDVVKKLFGKEAGKQKRTATFYIEGIAPLPDVQLDDPGQPQKLLPDLSASTLTPTAPKKAPTKTPPNMSTATWSGSIPQRLTLTPTRTTTTDMILRI